jgi:hypothetical protein
MNRANVPKEMQIHPGSKENEDLGRIPWDGQKTVGEMETSVLGELNPPKNSKIPQRDLEITNGGLGVTFTVKLERRMVRNEWNGEGVSSVRVVKSVKTR